MNRKNPTQKDIKKGPDKVILGFALIMSIFGLLMIFDASSFRASTVFDDQFHFLKLQAIWLGAGLVPAVIIYFWDYRKFIKLSIPFLIIVCIMLVILLVLGRMDDKTDLVRVVNDSSRWINIGPIPIQPAELLKPVFIMYLALWLSKDFRATSRIKLSKAKDLWSSEFGQKMVSFLVILFVVLILVVLEPDLGTTMVVGITAFAMFFLSGKDNLHTLGTIGMGVVFLFLATIAGLIEKYRLNRILTFVDLLRTGNVTNPTKEGYQMQQILIGIGSGGFWGKGFGQSRQRFGYLVENTAFTDSIFAIILEEQGTIGGIIIVFAWILFLWRGMLIAAKAPDRTGQLLAAGISIWLTVQALLNIGANVGLVPLTGIPLPFLTYGGSNTLVTIIGIAILLNISKYRT